MHQRFQGSIEHRANTSLQVRLRPAKVWSAESAMASARVLQLPSTTLPARLVRPKVARGSSDSSAAKALVFLRVSGS